MAKLARVKQWQHNYSESGQRSNEYRIIKLLHYNEQTNNDPNLPFKYYTNQPRDKQKIRNAISSLQMKTLKT